MAQFNRAVIFSGHMIDPPGRIPRRFPVECVPAVSEAIQRQLAEWGTGPQTLAICGGAPGSDTLFAEACLGRGVHVRLLLPFSVENFEAEIFKGTSAQWRHRFEALLPRCEVLCQPKCLGPLPPGVTAFERNNRWILDRARCRCAPGNRHHQSDGAWVLLTPSRSVSGPLGPSFAKGVSSNALTSAATAAVASG